MSTTNGCVVSSTPTIPVKVPTGTALQQDPPTLFTPLKIRGLEMQNRFVVSPMGTWSAEYGHLTDFHLVHYGELAFRGPGLTVIEATSVLPNGRTSPQDSGLWADSQVVPLKRVIDYIHSKSQKVGIQLGHAGRKSSMLAPEMAPTRAPAIATEAEGGWPDDVWAPSAIPYSQDYITPKPLSIEGIQGLVRAFADATRRAVQAGVDFIELHAAHGYLTHQFLSPLTNTRTDKYGGSFDNRIRFLLECIEAVQGELPDSIPLSIRISATEWMEWATNRQSWDMDQSLRLAKILANMGVDILDVSSGGNHNEQRILIEPNYQLDLAHAIRKALRKDGIGMLIAAVGFVDTPEVARKTVQAPAPADEEDEKRIADLAFVGRAFLKDPSFVLRSAKELGVAVQWPFQFHMALRKRLM